MVWVRVADKLSADLESRRVFVQLMLGVADLLFSLFWDSECVVQLILVLAKLFSGYFGSRRVFVAADFGSRRVCLVDLGLRRVVFNLFRVSQSFFNLIWSGRVLFS